MDVFASYRTFFITFYDAAVSLIAIVAALALSQGMTFDIPIDELSRIVLIVVGVQVVCFHFIGLYRGVWQFSSVPELLRVIKGSSLAVIASLAALALYNKLQGIHLGIFVIDWMVLIICLGGGRFYYRLRRDELRSLMRYHGYTEPDNVLIWGAGKVGARLMGDLMSGQSKVRVVGFIDDDPTLVGRTISGIKILGDSNDISKIVRSFNITQVLIAATGVPGEKISRVIGECEKFKTRFKIIPNLDNILLGKVNTSLRTVRLEDLLGRKEVQFDTDAVGRMITGKTVLITGAGGSIGRELCRQVARFKPKYLVAFEMSEFFLYRLEVDLVQSDPDLKLIPVIGDIKNPQRVDEAFARYKPEIVVHAAAYKHVPMMESNPKEAVATNIVGTKIVAQSSAKHKAQKFIMVSTDKAVNPSSIMGCTKRVAELVCQWMGEHFQQETQFIAVRFGNVIDSNGSVIPLFRRQIENRTDITITHPSMERFFMAVSEASQLILQAASMGRGGEVFVLDMGESVKIIDLAKKMVMLSGLELGKDIDIKIVGTRGGEKIKEECFSSSERLELTRHPKVRVARAPKLPLDFEHYMEELDGLLLQPNKDELIARLREAFSEFQVH